MPSHINTLTINNSSNKKIVEILSILLYAYSKDKSLKFKYYAIKKAIKGICDTNLKIISGKFAQSNIPGVKKGISDRIDEIIETGTLAELNNYKIDKQIEFYNYESELDTIPGIGETKAKELVEKYNIHTIEELRNAFDEGKVELSHSIQIGLKYYNDLKIKIPRKEIDTLYTIMQKELIKLGDNLELTICGSYRRGAILSGDIDILITDMSEYVSKDISKLLLNYVKKLTDIGLIIDNITTKGAKKYMGICKIGNSKIARHIDIRYIDKKSYYAALIYFTGNFEFNKYQRIIAKKKGYLLNEYGLKDLNTRKVISLKSEKELFDLLSMPYLKPEERSKNTYP